MTVLVEERTARYWVRPRTGSLLSTAVVVVGRNHPYSLVLLLFLVEIWVAQSYERSSLVPEFIAHVASRFDG